MSHKKGQTLITSFFSPPLLSHIFVRFSVKYKRGCEFLCAACLSYSLTPPSLPFCVDSPEAESVVFP